MKRIVTVKKFVIVTATRLDVVRPACTALIGKNHTHVHRLLGGLAIMLVGVIVAKYIGESETKVISIMGDTLGYGLHGLGLTPFIEGLLGEEA